DYTCKDVQFQDSILEDLWRTIWRLLFTAVLVGLVILTLTIYDDRKAVTHDGKITFNTIIT
ncbi:MAG: hypothetical protein LQ349_009813, partial [Xanthoria aureola]